MPDRWFYLESHVHAVQKGSKVFLYNPLNGRTLIYGPDPQALLFFKRLLCPDQLRVLGITDSELSCFPVREIVADIREAYMGDLLDCSWSRRKPVQLIPGVTIENDVHEESLFLEDSRKYLNELAIYIHNKCRLNCPDCDTACNQFYCCARHVPGNQGLSFSRIRTLFDDLRSYPVTRIHLLGGNLLDYPEWNNLPALLSKQNFTSTVYFHPEHICQAPESLHKLKETPTDIKLLIPGCFSFKYLKQAKNELNKLGRPWELIWGIRGLSEADQVKEICRELALDNGRVQPLFTGQNLNFFRESVFFEKEDILGSKPTSKALYANSTLNRLNFGRLTIKSDGQIHANLNTPALGQLGKQPLHELITRELREGTSWMATRESVAPCRDCIYSSLCPPITNYEYVMGRHNLCRIEGRELAGAA